MSEARAFLLYLDCVEYLTERGWYRDGDDPGIWWSITCTGISFGDALQRQLEADGVSMETV